MPLYLVERSFAEALELDPAKLTAVTQVHDELKVNWLFTFLSADKRKSYCLYDARDPEVLREAARRNNVPLDSIVEVSQAFGAPIAMPTPTV